MYVLLRLQLRQDDVKDRVDAETVALSVFDLFQVVCTSCPRALPQLCHGDTLDRVAQVEQHGVLVNCPRSLFVLLLLLFLTCLVWF